MKILNEKRKKRQGGFTLIELLVVIAIIAILGAVVAPKILQNPEKARKAAAMADVKAIQLQADIYQLDNAKAISSINDLVPKYIEDYPKDPWGSDYVLTINDGMAKISCPQLDQAIERDDPDITKSDVPFGRN